MSSELAKRSSDDSDDSKTLPALVGDYHSLMLSQASNDEAELLRVAGRLYRDGYFDHALLDLWNASVLNLRRRVEAYGIDLFLSVAKDEPGRKKFNVDGETLQERWAGVDDYLLVQVATKLGLLNKKAGRTLEMINWMRSHGSAAHLVDEKVGAEDFVAFAMLLQKNLFLCPFPDLGHSVSTLFDPVKTETLSDDTLELLKDQIRALRPQDVKVAFGFMLDLLCAGEVPSLENVKNLLPTVWARASEDLKKTAGIRYHTLTINKKADGSSDGNARQRILEMLIDVDGVKYIPDSARAVLFRHAVKSLAKAKDTEYGFSAEESAARTLAQLGTHVPAIAFTEVYQEILAVWCGNYWRRSTAYVHLGKFMNCLNTEQIRGVAQMFTSNERVRMELFQSKPKTEASRLLRMLRERLTVESHKAEVDAAIESVKLCDGLSYGI
jgi:hypothetical protein